MSNGRELNGQRVYFEDASGMLVETVGCENCTDGGRMTCPAPDSFTVQIHGCDQKQIWEAAERRVVSTHEQPPPTPDNHGPKKPVRKRTYSISTECPGACLAFSETMSQGADTHDDDEWKNLSVKELLAHADKHLAAYMLGDSSEQHLKHLHARVTMALETALLRGLRT